MEVSPEGARRKQLAHAETQRRNKQQEHGDLELEAAETMQGLDRDSINSSQSLWNTSHCSYTLSDDSSLSFARMLLDGVVAAETMQQVDHDSTNSSQSLRKKSHCSYTASEGSSLSFVRMLLDGVAATETMQGLDHDSTNSGQSLRKKSHCSYTASEVSTTSFVRTLLDGVVATADEGVAVESAAGAGICQSDSQMPVAMVEPAVMALCREELLQQQAGQGSSGLVGNIEDWPQTVWRERVENHDPDEHAVAGSCEEQTEQKENGMEVSPEGARRKQLAHAETQRRNKQQEHGDLEQEAAETMQGLDRDSINSIQSLWNKSHCSYTLSDDSSLSFARMLLDGVVAAETMQELDHDSTNSSRSLRNKSHCSYTASEGSSSSFARVLLDDIVAAETMQGLDHDSNSSSQSLRNKSHCSYTASDASNSSFARTLLAGVVATADEIVSVESTARTCICQSESLMPVMAMEEPAAMVLGGEESLQKQAGQSRSGVVGSTEDSPQTGWRKRLENHDPDEHAMPGSCEDQIEQKEHSMEVSPEGARHKQLAHVEMQRRNQQQEHNDVELMQLLGHAVVHPSSPSSAPCTGSLPFDPEVPSGQVSMPRAKVLRKRTKGFLSATEPTCEALPPAAIEFPVESARSNIFDNVATSDDLGGSMLLIRFPNAPWPPPPDFEAKLRGGLVAIGGTMLDKIIVSLRQGSVIAELSGDSMVLEELRRLPLRKLRVDGFGVSELWTEPLEDQLAPSVKKDSSAWIKCLRSGDVGRTGDTMVDGGLPSAVTALPDAELGEPNVVTDQYSGSHLDLLHEPQQAVIEAGLSYGPGVLQLLPKLYFSRQPTISCEGLSDALPLAFRASPELPAGVGIDSTSGRLHGVPVGFSPRRTYKINAEVAVAGGQRRILQTLLVIGVDSIAPVDTEERVVGTRLSTSLHGEVEIRLPSAPPAEQMQAAMLNMEAGEAPVPLAMPKEDVRKAFEAIEAEDVLALTAVIRRSHGACVDSTLAIDPQGRTMLEAARESRNRQMLDILSSKLDERLTGHRTTIEAECFPDLHAAHPPATFGTPENACCISADFLSQMPSQSHTLAAEAPTLPDCALLRRCDQNAISAGSADGGLLDGAASALPVSPPQGLWYPSIDRIFDASRPDQEQWNLKAPKAGPALPPLKSPKVRCQTARVPLGRRPPSQLVLVPSLELGRPDNFKVQPALPKGMQLDEVTGVIRGAPMVISDRKTWSTFHKVSAENPSGTASVVCRIEVDVGAWDMIHVSIRCRRGRGVAMTDSKGGAQGSTSCPSSPSSPSVAEVLAQRDLQEIGAHSNVQAPLQEPHIDWAEIIDKAVALIEAQGFYTPIKPSTITAYALKESHACTIVKCLGAAKLFQILNLCHDSNVLRLLQQALLEQRVPAIPGINLLDSAESVRSGKLVFFLSATGDKFEHRGRASMSAVIPRRHGREGKAALTRRRLFKQDSTWNFNPGAEVLVGQCFRPTEEAKWLASPSAEELCRKIGATTSPHQPVRLPEVAGSLDSAACPSCGAAFMPEAVFCRKCGSKRCAEDAFISRIEANKAMNSRTLDRDNISRDFSSYLPCWRERLIDEDVAKRVLGFRKWKPDTMLHARAVDLQ